MGLVAAIGGSSPSRPGCPSRPLKSSPWSESEPLDESELASSSPPPSTSAPTTASPPAKAASAAFKRDGVSSARSVTNGPASGSAKGSASGSERAELMTATASSLREDINDTCAVRSRCLACWMRAWSAACASPPSGVVVDRSAVRDRSGEDMLGQTATPALGWSGSPVHRLLCTLAVAQLLRSTVCSSLVPVPTDRYLALSQNCAPQAPKFHCKIAFFEAQIS